MLKTALYLSLAVSAMAHDHKSMPVAEPSCQEKLTACGHEVQPLVCLSTASVECLEEFKTTPAFLCNPEITQFCDWSQIGSDELTVCLRERLPELSPKCAAAVKPTHHDGDHTHHHHDGDKTLDSHSTKKDSHGHKTRHHMKKYAAGAVALLLLTCICCCVRRRRRMRRRRECQRNSSSLPAPPVVVVSHMNAPAQAAYPTATLPMATMVPPAQQIQLQAYQPGYTGYARLV